MANERTQRIVLKVEEVSDGMWVMKQCKDNWTTLPFKWPSKASAIHDLDIIVRALQSKGYEVIPPEKEAPNQQ
jgi:hypothetical protein